MTKKLPSNKGPLPEYTQEIADRICLGLAEGRSLRNICLEKDMPAPSTVVTWAMKDYCGFFEQYARARETGIHLMLDDIIRLADDVNSGIDVADRKLMVDTRKWIMSRVLRKTYGDNVPAIAAQPAVNVHVSG